nr:MAG TPA: hypothetical protein [Caudoviricetes sp.]
MPHPVVLYTMAGLCTMSDLLGHVLHERLYEPFCYGNVGCHAGTLCPAC